MIAAGVLVVASGALLARPPRALQDFLTVYDVALPRALAAGQSAASRGAADSVVQAGSVATSAGAELASPSMAADTLSARLPLSADTLSPLGSRHAAMHLGAIADSGTASGAPGTQTTEQDAREILMHVARARELARTMALKGAGMELRTAYQEYRIFLTEHASAPQTAMLRQEMQAAMDEGLAACRVALDSVVAQGRPAFRCQHPAKTGVLMDDSEEATTAPPPALAP